MAHSKSLTKELETMTSIAAKTHKECTFIQRLKFAIDGILKADVDSKQGCKCQASKPTPKQPASIGRSNELLEAPAIMKTRDPTAKRNLVNMARTHQRRTHNNTPGAVPAITIATSVVIHPDIVTPLPMQKLTRLQKQSTYPTVELMQGPLIVPPYANPGGVQASARLINQQALNNA